MSTYPPTAFAKLRGFARSGPALERCEMCKTVLAEDHVHLLEPATRKLICACDPCSLLFDTRTRYKRVPRQARALTGFQLNESQWAGLMLPINLVFFYHSTPQGRVVAMYPSPAGATESLLSFETWSEIVRENPVLEAMEADVEALLVNRVGHARGFIEAEHYLVGIDQCYRLVGLIRTHWQGLSGGTEVWRELGDFFTSLKSHSREAAHA